MSKTTSFTSLIWGQHGSIREEQARLRRNRQRRNARRAKRANRYI